MGTWILTFATRRYMAVDAMVRRMTGEDLWCAAIKKEERQAELMDIIEHAAGKTVDQELAKLVVANNEMRGRMIRMERSIGTLEKLVTKVLENSAGAGTTAAENGRPKSADLSLTSSSKNKAGGKWNIAKQRSRAQQQR